jgi:membrane dipeptidase
MLHDEMNRRRFLNTSAGLSLAGTAAGLTAAEAGDPDRSSGSKKDRDAKPRRNAQMQHAWSVALDILQPTGKQLEHGLELHRQSLVFDAYGFSPRAAVDGAAVARAVEQGASEIELQDLREDLSMTRCVTDPVERSEFEQAWQAAGVTCIFQNAGEEGQDPLRLIKRLARFTFVTDMLPDFVSKAATPADVEVAKKEGRHCLYLTGNGVPLTQQWVSTHDELRYLRIFFQLGIRMMHLTYNRRNMIGDGCAEKANAGLSDFGRIAVAEMNRVGVIADCAHSGWQTSLEAAQLSTRPMVASHTTCAALHRHIRSKPDKVIRAIADTGGYIAICCIPRFLGGKGDVAAFIDHIEYVAKKFGVDHVGIGTDVVYSSSQTKEENKKIPRRSRRRTRWAALWPPDPFVTTPEARASLAWTNWPLFTVGLVQRGFSDVEIKKIIGGNVMRVTRAVLE